MDEKRLLPIYGKIPSHSKRPIFIQTHKKTSRLARLAPPCINSMTVSNRLTQLQQRRNVESKNNWNLAESHRKRVTQLLIDPKKRKPEAMRPRCWQLQ